MEPQNPNLAATDIFSQTQQNIQIFWWFGFWTSVCLPLQPAYLTVSVSCYVIRDKPPSHSMVLLLFWCLDLCLVLCQQQKQVRAICSATKAGGICPLVTFLAWNRWNLSSKEGSWHPLGNKTVEGTLQWCIKGLCYFKMDFIIVFGNTSFVTGQQYSHFLELHILQHFFWWKPGHSYILA